MKGLWTLLLRVLSPVLKVTKSDFHNPVVTKLEGLGRQTSQTGDILKSLVRTRTRQSQRPGPVAGQVTPRSGVDYFPGIRASGRWAGAKI